MYTISLTKIEEKGEKSCPVIPAFGTRTCLPSGRACYLCDRAQWPRCPAGRHAGQLASTRPVGAPVCLFQWLLSLVEPPLAFLRPRWARLPGLPPTLVWRLREARPSLCVELNALVSPGRAAAQTFHVGPRTAPLPACAPKAPGPQPRGPLLSLAAKRGGSPAGVSFPWVPCALRTDFHTHTVQGVCVTEMTASAMFHQLAVTPACGNAQGLMSGDPSCLRAWVGGRGRGCAGTSGPAWRLGGGSSCQGRPGGASVRLLWPTEARTPAGARQDRFGARQAWGYVPATPLGPVTQPLWAAAASRVDGQLGLQGACGALRG